MRTTRLLRSEIGRHSLAGAVIAAASIAGTWIIIRSQLISADDGPQRVLEVMFGLLLTTFGIYGPFFLLLTSLGFRRLEGEAFRQSLQRSAPRHGVARALTRGWSVQWAVYVALVSVVAVLVLALNSQFRSQPLLLAACLVCVVGNWILLVTAFAVEYARAWAVGGGFRFPDGDDSNRTLGDFFYAAIQVSTTYASSDVELTDRRSRRLVSVHAITGFVFSSVIVALLVSLLLSSS